MQILNEDNQILDTDKISKSCHYSVLRFKDAKNPDFFFTKLDHIEEFTSPTMKVDIGGHTSFIPFHWSILCTDQEYIHTIPLYEFSGRQFDAFCINPIDGFIPYYLPVRMVEVYQATTWSCPPLHDKDLLVMPIGYRPNNTQADKGPICVILTPHKIDINRSLADIL